MLTLQRYLQHNDIEEFIITVHSKLRDRYCIPIMIDLISQTTFAPYKDREFGFYGPLPADDDLFDLDDWQGDIV